MRIGILDGYVDEPANFGVPPYIAPQPRYVWGAAAESGCDVTYVTIDQYRKDAEARSRIHASDLNVLYASALVPGKYLRGTPITFEEALLFAKRTAGKSILGGSCAVYGFSKGGGLAPDSRNALKPYLLGLATLDADAYLWDHLHGRWSRKEGLEFPEYGADVPNTAFVESGGRLLVRMTDAKGHPLQRRRTQQEWERFAKAGVPAVESHPDFPHPLIAELETYTGCVRYVNGGCRFCLEPREGKPLWRDEPDIAAEVRLLYERGVRNFRLGGQTCFFCYKTKQLGDGDRPRPNPDAVERLLQGVRDAAPNLRVLHIDNANPAILATWPDESRAIARSIVEHCTPGNVAAFGLESVDQRVFDANNLNSSADEVAGAVALLNEVGGGRGANGMPHLLPGVNFIAGLDGEAADTYDQNYAFLERLFRDGHTLRRINLRQLLPITGGLKPISKKQHTRFLEFKRRVRENIDRPLLERMLPPRTVLKDVWLEVREGDNTFGRQIGSYALLVGVRYRLPLEAFTDVVVTDYGFRSVSGFHAPFPINAATPRMFRALPGFGDARAETAVRGQPYETVDEFFSRLGLAAEHDWLRAHLVAA
ncbi:MAG TPA: radical SAM protein [Candidatus Thermoplasmatota archaeon]|nr:radical SAM protein [Candidatus Thermoplasmatota archaeon]